jgi:hypothetical protein
LVTRKNYTQHKMKSPKININMALEKLKYPIGKFENPKEVTGAMFRHYISDISTFPQRLRNEVMTLSDLQLNTTYRPGGWTIKQVINHCADSHVNAFTRLKLTLTEDKPTIKPYYEDRWAELPDGKNIPVEPALKILEGIHERWAVLLNSLTTEQMKLTFIHPEQGREISIAENTALYAWHCRHHLAHITSLKNTEGWK